MQKLKIMILSALLALLPVGAGVALAHAQSFQTEVGQDQTVDSSLYSASRSVDIRGTVNGDVYCAGQNIVVDAVVHGDVLCVGQTVLIGGQVDGSVRAAGQNVTVTAKIGRSLSAAGQEVTLTKNASVGQDATLGGSSLTVEGPIARDAIIGSTSAKLAGNVGRDIRFGGTNLTLASGARVGGSLTYTSQNVASISKQATVMGKVTHNTPQPEPKKRGSLLGFGLVTFFMALAALLFYLVLVLLFPQAVHAVANEAVRAPLKTFLTGLVAAIVVPVVIVGLLFTLIGIPLALFLGLVWLVVISLSGPVAAYYLGRLLWRQGTNPFLIMLLGVVVLLIVAFIPFIGLLAGFVAYFFGAGSILLALQRVIPKPHYHLKESKAK